MSIANIGKITLAFVAAPASAVITLAFLVFVLVPLAGHDPNTPSQVAFHFALFGAIIIFPVSIIAGLPLYLLFKFKGWLTRRAVFIGSVFLSLAYPVFVTLQNPNGPAPITSLQYLVCLVCGLVAAWVFCSIAGLASGSTHGHSKP